MTVVVEVATRKVVGQVLAESGDGSYTVLMRGGERIEGFTLGAAYQVETIG